jgi:hypothetical protein
MPRQKPSHFDLAGRFVPEKYLAGLPPQLRERRLAELTASREGRFGYDPLPTDLEAQARGLVKRSSYIVEAERRGLEHRGDYADTARRALRYYGAPVTEKNVSTVAAELEKVFKKGLAAWQTGGHRPGASQSGWAYARVASVLVGGKAAHTADARNVEKFPIEMQRGILSKKAAWKEGQDMRSNPMIGWESVGIPFQPDEIDRATRPLFSPNAARVYTEKLKSVPLDLYVLVGKDTPDGAVRQHAEELAEAGNTVLWVDATFFDLLGSGSREVLNRPRGAYSRISPMSPFTLLHRMGDIISESRREETSSLTAPLQAIKYKHFPGLPLPPAGSKPSVLFRHRASSPGVDTEAGRNAWIPVPTEAVSELWAKYLLTGRIAYDPNATLPGDSWTPEELEARKEFLRRLNIVFPIRLSLSRGRIFRLFRYIPYKEGREDLRTPPQARFNRGELSSSVTANRAEIEEMLRTAPSDWTRQFNSSLEKLNSLGVDTQVSDPVDRAMLPLRITAGGNRSGDVPRGSSVVPEDVRKEAMHGLRLSHANNYGAWDFIGIARAIQLATQPGVPGTTKSRMQNYFSRHRRDKLGGGWGSERSPSRGYMAWLNWGGDAGLKWVG